MKLKHALVLIAALTALLIGMIGCGGGGGSVGGDSGALFITDGLDGHDHVWVTMKKAVLTGASGNVTVFDEPSGKTFDLKSLRDGSGERYAFIGTIPNGTYTGITFTLDKTLTLFPAGSQNGLTRVFAGNNGSTVNLVLSFTSTQSVNRDQNLALDFDLASWTDDGVTVSGAPFLKEGQGHGLGDMERHEHNSRWGTVTDLRGNAPDQTFNLTRRGLTVAVVTNRDTDFRNSEPARPFQLENGKIVKVTGRYSVELGAIVADSIRIRSRSEEEEEPEVEGPVSNINAGAGTFTITIEEADHFQPLFATVDIITDEHTVFTSRTGLVVSPAEFFAGLVEGTELQAVGEYDPATNTITAIRVSYEDEEGGGNGGGGNTSGGNTTGGNNTGGNTTGGNNTGGNTTGGNNTGGNTTGG